MQENHENSENELSECENTNQENNSESFFHNLKKSGNGFIGFQSVLDALDLWNCSLKLYFDALDYESGSEALNDWLISPIGTSCFFIGAAFLSLFAYFGNAMPKSIESPIVKYADTLWPYFRDTIKGLKWTFKGVRNLLSVVCVFQQYQLLHYLTPIGLGFGLLSAINRMWNRHMVETRKAMQVQNDEFRRQIKGIHACYHEVTADLVWDENQEIRTEILRNIYAGSILKISSKENEYYRVTAQGELISLENLSNDPFIILLNKELQTGSNGVVTSRIYWDRLDTLIQKQHPSQLFLEVLKDKIAHLKQLQEHNSDALQFIHQQAVFQNNSVEAYISAFLNGVLNAPYYFLGILSMVTLPYHIFLAAFCICVVFMVLNIAAELYQEQDYQRRLRISQLKANLIKTKRLLLLEWQSINILAVGKGFSADCFQPLKKHIQEIIEKLDSQNDALKSMLEHLLNENPVHNPKINFIEVLKDIERFQSNRDDYFLLQRCINITRYEQDYTMQYQQLKNQLRLNNTNVFWQGLRNGLVVSGAFNSLLITISSMKFLVHIGISPLFLYLSILAGIFLLTLTTIYTMKMVNSNSEEISEDQEQLNESNIYYFIAKSTINIFNIADIQASKNLLISEHSEIFRQLLSGFKKGIKFLQTTNHYLTFMDYFSVLLNNLIYGVVGLIFSIFFAFKGLRGLMRVDEQAYQNSFLYKFFNPKTEQQAKQCNNKVQRTKSNIDITDKYLQLQLERSSPSPERHSSHFDFSEFDTPSLEMFSNEIKIL